MESGTSLVPKIPIAGIIILLCVFLFKLYHARSFVRRLQKQGLPMPPHHWLFGHIALSAKIFARLPPLAHGSYLGDQIRQRYPHLDSAFYLDIWPFGPLILVLMSPDAIYQLTQANQIPKFKGLRHFLRPITEKENLVTLEGATWKQLRKMMNPGFKASHLSTLVPEMVEEMIQFKKIVKKHARSGAFFYLEDAIENLFMDIAGRVVMDHKFGSQTGHDDLTTTLRNQIEWCTTGINIDPWEYFNVFRPVIQWYNTHKMNRYLNKRLDHRFQAIQEKGVNGKNYVIDLVLKSYLQENPSATSIDPAFKKWAVAQIKGFIFAGHDATSASGVFSYHLLAQHPEVLAKLRAEHDRVFGVDTEAAASLLCSNPLLLNQLPYTLAVIKECLRIYPLVAALRQGHPSFSLTTQSGQTLPTDQCLIWGDHYGLHHNPRYWPRPEEFLPERFLVPGGHELYQAKNAWRPFERGPRNCIGQELAFLEIKLMLALTVREFDFRDDYEMFDSVRRNPKGWNVDGRRAYMIRRSGGHPAQRYPCTVSFAQRGEGGDGED